MNQHTRLEERPIPFIDVAAQRRRLGRAVDDAVARVLAHCQFVNGPEVRAFESDLAAFCGARHAIGCASGTDALLLVLMAWEIKPGDAVICPSFTYHATAEMVALLGATPIIADVSPETFNLDPASCERGVATAKRLGLKPRAIIPVDLFGLPADHEAITAIAKKYDLKILDDAAQGFGATYRGKKLGTLGTATATSFFPAKPLGCYGDGGAVFTDDDALAARVKSIRLHGEGVDRSEAARIGITGRLDTIQAAILIEKLKIFPDEIAARNRAAERYAQALADVAVVPRVGNEFDFGLGPIHHQAQARSARQACRRSEGASDSDRDLLHQAPAQAAGLSRFPARRRRRAGERAIVGRSHQPADARLFGTARSGPHHRRGPQSARLVARGWLLKPIRVGRTPTAPFPLSRDRALRDN